MKAITLVSDIGQLVLMLIVTGYTVYFVKDVTFRMKTQVEYEMEFLDRHEITINRLQRLPLETNECMLLTFQNLQAENLLKLCEQYRGKWSPERCANKLNFRFDQPRIEVHFLRLRRLAVAGELFKIQVIRCNEKYALIEAGDGISGYVLEKDELNKNAAITVFIMYGKFKYN